MISVLRAVVCLSFLFLLLAGEGFFQCYSDTACSGNLVPAANQRECCIETDEGLAFSAGGTCNMCIGIISFTEVYTCREGLCTTVSCFLPAFMVSIPLTFHIYP